MRWSPLRLSLEIAVGLAPKRYCERCCQPSLSLPLGPAPSITKAHSTEGGRDLCWARHSPVVVSAFFRERVQKFPHSRTTGKAGEVVTPPTIRKPLVMQ